MSESAIKYHPDNVFLISGYVGTPDTLDAKFVIAPNKELSIETVVSENKEFVAISVVSLSEMRQVLAGMESTAKGENKAALVNRMFA